MVAHDTEKVESLKHLLFDALVKSFQFLIVQVVEYEAFGYSELKTNLAVWSREGRYDIQVMCYVIQLVKGAQDDSLQDPVC